MPLHSVTVCNDCGPVSNAAVSIAPYISSLYVFQIKNGCDREMLADTQFTFQLIVDDIEGDDDTTGFYSVSFTNPGGSTAVEETFVTPFGKEDSS